MTGSNNIASATDLADSVTVILTMLRKIIADQGILRRINPVLIRLIWTRIGYWLHRFCTLATNPPPTRATRIRTRAPACKPSVAPAPITLPRTRFWLVRLLPGHQIPGAASQLRHLIETADMTALVTQTPQLGRVLRPLCHTLGIALPAYLRLPTRPRPTPKPRPPRPKRPPKPPPTPLTLFDYLQQKYPPLQRPQLPGHRYSPFFKAR
ncbi:MAG TPA: hypothetical protein PK677_07925 [Acidiphilium sp.]|nr:hypothetical protein [Acidiphilium sp.]HQU23296.1 hypothetical protein [Acidiphilium sp.]